MTTFWLGPFRIAKGPLAGGGRQTWMITRANGQAHRTGFKYLKDAREACRLLNLAPKVTAS